MQQDSLLDDEKIESSNGPVECLGQTFANEEARRKHFTKLLSEKLKDPEFRKVDGFPNGTDEAILELSNPPYYTACPNPWLNTFVEFWEEQKTKQHEDYHREPLAIDVSVGKTDALYKAHAYHTKVPHLAITPSLLHYTKPGDIVLDGFCGSGMTGVASQWCSVAPNEYKTKINKEFLVTGLQAPEWGDRKVILNDLSPAATFIAKSYNSGFNSELLLDAGQKLLGDLKKEFGWMYETLHSDGVTKCLIDYTVWSEVLICDACSEEVVFVSDIDADKPKTGAGLVKCNSCGSESKKEKLDLVFESFMNTTSGEIDSRPKRVPVAIFYKLGKSKFCKKPDSEDLKTLKKIEELEVTNDFPKDFLPDCQMTRVGRMKTTKTSNILSMFLPRSAYISSKLWEFARLHNNNVDGDLKFFVEQAIWTLSLLNRYRPTGFSQVNQFLSGVFYIGSQHAECSPWYVLEGKLSRLSKVFANYKPEQKNAVISVGTAQKLGLPNNSIDYIFTDPPFGENIYYSDLNFLIESWHKVKTQPKSEAIVDRVKKKGIPEYQILMQSCFTEYFRVLKPGRWMTVVFSNSKAAIWNAIQVALQQSGFVVAEVTALDKVQGSFQQVVSTNAVKQDLVISVYKPNEELENYFNVENTEKTLWGFILEHLSQLPVVKKTQGDSPELLSVIEREPRRIYDRMASWFIRHGVLVPISTADFIQELEERFVLVDNMVFLPNQANTYKIAVANVPKTKQIELFISDERSAIEWLKQYISKKPSTRADITPIYIPLIGSAIKKGEIIPELSSLLEDNFLMYDGAEDVPSQIHSYLSTNYKDMRGLAKDNVELKGKAKGRWFVPSANKKVDIERRRNKGLLKEFNLYLSAKKAKLKEVRLEVLHAGFNDLWSKNEYETLIKLADLLPSNIIQEDEKLLMFYDNALTLTSNDDDDWD